LKKIVSAKYKNRLIAWKTVKERIAEDEKTGKQFFCRLLFEGNYILRQSFKAAN